MRAIPALGLSILILTASCAAPETADRERSDPGGPWYAEELRRLTVENACLPAAGRRDGQPTAFLQTPEYFAIWCERAPENIPGKIVCLDPPKPKDGADQTGQLGILACWREFDRAAREPPSYDLIVLTSHANHDWRGCPKIVKLELYGTHPLWIEKNPKPYGQALSLSEFWVAKAAWEETELVVSDAPADGHALLYGQDDAGQILYCHDGQWVMSGFH